MLIKMNYENAKELVQDIKLLMNQYEEKIKDFEYVLNQIEENHGWEGLDQQSFLNNLRGKYLPSMKKIYDEGLTYPNFMLNQVNEYFSIEQRLLETAERVVKHE